MRNKTSKTSKNKPKFIKIKSAEKQITQLLEIKDKISDISQKIISELRQINHSINQVIEDKYDIDKLHTVTGVGNINYLYDDVIIYVQNSVTNKLFPSVMESMVTIRDLLVDLETKITSFKHFNKRKRLQAIIKNINKWKVKLLNFADFVETYNKIIDFHLKKSNEAEFGINKVDIIKKIRNIDFLRISSEFWKNILYTEPHKHGNSNQLIIDMNKFLRHLQKLYINAVPRIQKFNINSMGLINRISKNIYKKINAQKSALSQKENSEKWIKSYFPIFLDKWDIYNLQVFPDFYKAIENGQKEFKELLKSEQNFRILKDLILNTFNNFIIIVSENIGFLQKTWKKWITKINFSDCNENQFQLLVKTEAMIYKQTDMLEETFKDIYYDARYLQSKIEIDDAGSIDKFFLDLSINNFYNLTLKKVQKLEITYYEENSDFYKLIFASKGKNFDEEFNQTVNYDAMHEWINLIHIKKAFPICDFNLITNNNSTIQAAALKVDANETPQLFNAKWNLDLLKEPEIKYALPILSFFLFLFLFMKCFSKSVKNELKNKRKEKKRLLKTKIAESEESKTTSFIKNQNDLVLDKTDDLNSEIELTTHSSLDIIDLPFESLSSENTEQESLETFRAPH